MNFFTNLFDFNPSTLSGCIDIIAVRQPDGSIKVSPFHVRFGKNMGILKSNKKLVNILINDQNTDIVMKLNSAGVAYFVEVSHEKIEDVNLCASSPVVSETGDNEGDENEAIN